MNFSWNNQAIKKKPLGFGLNPRTSSSSEGAGGGGAAAVPPRGNVFGDDDDDDNDDDDQSLGENRGGTTDARQRINREIVKEQAAIRQRALRAAEQAQRESTHNKAGGGDNINKPAIYDYDGAYDSFATQPSASNQKEGEGPVKEHRKSRYIGNLLETAKKRQQEREAVMERKIAKEQAVEDAQEDFAGKEKFVTKAYRRKLEERKQWQAEEDAKDKEETANDVTQKTTAGAAMARFYGNFSNNVAVGGTGNTGKNPGGTTKELGKVEATNKDDDDFRPIKGGSGGMGFLAGFERSEPAAADVDSTDDVDGPQRVKHVNSPEPVLTLRQRREHKVAAARIRYLKRKAAVAASN